MNIEKSGKKRSTIIFVLSLLSLVAAIVIFILGLINIKPAQVCCLSPVFFILFALGFYLFFRRTVEYNNKLWDE